MPGVEGPELRVERRGLVEAHRVDDLLEVIGVYREEGDAPLEVVDPGGARDHLEDPAGELPPARPVRVHQLLAVVVREREPVAHVAAPLRHRVEAEGRLALGRELRVETSLPHLLRARPGAYSDSSVSET